MIKSTRKGYCDHVQSIRNLSACVENSGELGWVVDCSLGGERWDGKEEEGETEEESVGREGSYIMAFTDGMYLSVISSVIPSVKSSEKTPRHHTVASFQTIFIGHRRSGRYIPTDIFHRYISIVSPMELVRRYIPINFEMKLFSSVIITNEKIPSVISLVFASFLVLVPQFIIFLIWSFNISLTCN